MMFLIQMLRKKSQMLFKFAKDYKNDPSCTASVLREPGITVIGSPKETWDYIKKDNRSLERHSILVNCFPSE